MAIRLWRSSGGGSICSTDSARTATDGSYFSASSVAHSSQRSRRFRDDALLAPVEPADGVAARSSGSGAGSFVDPWRQEARIFSMPRRMRPFIVPSGRTASLRSRVAEAAEEGERDHPGLLSSGRSESAPRTSRAVSRRSAPASVRSSEGRFSSSSSESNASFGARPASRRSRSMARLRTMPRRPCADAAARPVETRPAAPDRDQRLLGHVLGGLAAADDPVGEREGSSAVTIEDLERERVLCRNERHQTRGRPGAGDQQGSSVIQIQEVHANRYDLPATTDQRRY